MKKYANSALMYAILAMVGGVFFREFTKFNGFEGGNDPRVRPHPLLCVGHDRLPLARAA